VLEKYVSKTCKSQEHQQRKQHFFMNIHFRTRAASICLGGEDKREKLIIATDMAYIR
jgi:hypothetical protein